MTYKCSKSYEKHSIGENYTKITESNPAALLTLDPCGRVTPVQVRAYILAYIDSIQTG